MVSAVLKHVLCAPLIHVHDVITTAAAKLIILVGMLGLFLLLSFSAFALGDCQCFSGCRCKNSEKNKNADSLNAATALFMAWQ